MFDFDKGLMKIYGFFVVMLCIAVYIYLTIKLIEVVFWQLCLGLLILGLLAALAWFLYSRFWRW